MKILVTGALGFIGSHFCKMAVGRRHHVIGLDALAYSGRLKNVKGLAMSCYVDDICDAYAVGEILSITRPDAIVHLAAESHVARSIESREEFLRTNVLGTNTLLEQSLKYWRTNSAFRFLHVSTDEVYGSLGELENPWTENSPYRPNNGYSASKAASDHLVRSYRHTYGLPTITTHSANNYGTHQHPEKLIPTLIRQCMNGESMTLHGDGLQMRDWLHVEDHCSGLLAALSGEIGETYNFGGMCERTNLQIAELVLRNFGLENFAHKLITHVDDRPGNDRRYAMDISKSWTQLNWQPLHRIEDRIGEVVQWYTENPTYGDDYGK